MKEKLWDFTDPPAKEIALNAGARWWKWIAVVRKACCLCGMSASEMIVTGNGCSGYSHLRRIMPATSINRFGVAPVNFSPRGAGLVPYFAARPRFFCIKHDPCRKDAFLSKSKKGLIREMGR